VDKAKDQRLVDDFRKKLQGPPLLLPPYACAGKPSPNEDVAATLLGMRIVDVNKISHRHGPPKRGKKCSAKQALNALQMGWVTSDKANKSLLKRDPRHAPGGRGPRRLSTALALGAARCLRACSSRPPP
jgi:hypothetical protein